MWRKALTVAITVAMVALSGPAVMFAKAPVVAGSIAGRAVDASGGAVSAQRVELMGGGRVVNIATTNAFGEWSFADVWPGEYIVRMSVRSKIAGVRVSVAAGQALSGTLIVVPTAAVAPQLGSLASLLTLVPSAAAAVTTAAAAASITTETTQLDEVLLKDIITQLAPADRVIFAQAIIQATTQANTNSGNTGGNTGGNSNANPFSQYQDQFTEVISSGGNTIPTFPAPRGVSGG